MVAARAASGFLAGGDVVEHRDSAGPARRVAQGTTGDADDDAIGLGGVADDHLDLVGGLVGQRPDQGHLLGGERGGAVGQVDAVVGLPVVGAVDVVGDAEHGARHGRRVRAVGSGPSVRRRGGSPATSILSREGKRPRAVAKINAL